jgi:hypothetical protein
VVRVAIDLKNLVPETGMDTDWEHFCRETIYSIENRWNRKLDESQEEEKSEESFDKGEQLPEE